MTDCQAADLLTMTRTFALFSWYALLAVACVSVIVSIVRQSFR